MTFKDWIADYQGVINPTTGRYWTPSEVAQATGMPMSTLIEWLQYSMRANLEYVMVNNEPMSDNLMIEKWNTDHPPVRSIYTPFGNITVPIQVDPSSKNIMDWTVRELVEFIDNLRVS